MSLRSYLSHLNRRDTRILPRFSTLVVIAIISLTILTAFSLVRASQAKNIIFEQQNNIDAANNVSYLTSEVTDAKSVVALKAIVGKVNLNADGSLKTSWIPGGAIGSLNQSISMLYNQPVSGIQYVAYLRDNFLGKPAYAQGYGFAKLQPLLLIWSQMRNTVYVISSFFFIIIGFMIMLRVKISPQATVTIQNAIPQLVTTLILVTFSYAIAGFVIDMSYVLQGMAIAIITPGIIGGGAINNISNLLSGIPAVGKIIPSLRSTVEPDLFTTSVYLMVPTFVIILLGGVVGTIITIIFSIFSVIFTGGSTLPGLVVGLGLGGVLVIILFLIGLIIGIFKFFFGLLKCYATIIFKIIIGPLEIAMGAFPNSKMGFSSWVLDLIANVAVFPMSFIILYLANDIIINILLGQGAVTLTQVAKLVLGGGSVSAVANSGLWVPSLLGGSILGDGSLIAAAAIGVGTISLLGKLPEMIPQFVFMLKPSPWGQAIGEATDFSKNPIYKTAKGTAFNYAGGEIGKGATGRGIFGKIGGTIESNASLDAAIATGEAVKNTGK